jgi:hypothetical protein
MALTETIKDRQVGWGRLPSELSCDLFVFCFAAWTVVCNVCVLAGLSFSTLLLATPVALALAGAVAWWHLRSNAREQESATDNSDSEPLSTRRWATLGAIAVAIVGCAGIYLLSDWRPVWWLLIAYFTVLWFTTRSSVQRFDRPIDSPGNGWGLATLAGVCAVLALVAHRWDSDDSLYLNFAVAAVDSPHEPLMAHDTIHGDPTLALVLPVYRAHSFELLAGAVSFVTGLPVIIVDHLVFAPMLAGMVCLAWAALLRLIAPRHWPSVLVAVMTVYLTFGGDHRWYANFAFVRIFQGKSALLTIAAPLIMRAVIRLRVAPTLSNWALLAVGQVTAGGLSSTGLWLGPTVGALTTLAFAPIGWTGLVYASRSISASFYPVLLVLYFKSQMAQAQPILDLYYTWTWQQVAEIMFGFGWVRYATVVALVLAWRTTSGSIGRLFAISLPLLALLTFLNPYLATWIGDHLVGSPAYFRAWWVLPVPFFLGLLLAWPAAAGWPRIARWAALGACVLFLPPYLELSEKNRVHLAWPTLKVDHLAYQSAKVLARRPGLAREHVLAPPAVGLWLPTFHHHPYPLVSREDFINNYRDERLPERLRRLALAAYVAGQGHAEEGRDLLTESFAKDHLRAVCLERNASWAGDVEASLRRAGFTMFHTNEKYKFWEKAAEPPR